ncbi:MAG: tryptophan 7-halogenase, partial [Thermoanaerobaculales bacterium]
LKTRLPELDVTVVHSSSIPIIGVGEGTTFAMPIYLHGYLGIDPGEFHREVQATYKLGIRFLWGPRPRFHYTFTNQLDARRPELPKANGYYCFEDYDFADMTGALMAQGKGFVRQQVGGGPEVNTNVAYHIENEAFTEFLAKRAPRVGVRVLDDKVEGIEQGEEGIKSLKLASGESLEGDLFIDCSGFRSMLLGEALEEPFVSFGSSLFCDRAVAGGWARSDEPLLPFTTAETMDSGWCWQIEHDRIINRGYVYSSNAISDDDAEREFRHKNPKITDTRIINWTPGCRRRVWVKNVVALGNSAGFVEPLEATNLAVICDHAAKLVQNLTDSSMRIDPASRKFFNRYTHRTWQSIRRFLTMHYRFNTRLETPFWKACQEETDLAGGEEIVEYYKECGPALLWAAEAMGPEDPFSWEGYLAMLVGMKVPHRGAHTPNAEEREIWRAYMRQLNQTAANGMSMEEAVRLIRSPNWSWKPDFYPSANRW